jgi:3-methyladenine DNA glycosylase/8-oxoguanine DNA glycosylase
MYQARVDVRRNLKTVLGVLSRGRSDPAYRYADGALWLTGLGKEGAFSVRLVADEVAVTGTYWGDGARWAADHLADLVGADDDPSGFLPQHRIVATQWRKHGTTWAVPRSLLTWQVAVAAVLEQRVTGVEARGAWAGLLAEHGSAAPGPVPAGMRVPPDPAALLAVPSWDWRRYGVDRQRIETLRQVAKVPHMLARAAELPPAQGREALTGIPGVGSWTAAEISSRAFGDADAVSVGDYHLARNVTYALTNREDGTDDDMIDLLAVYDGHRHRAVRMIELAGIAPPRRGPRMRLPGPGGGRR